MNIWTPILSEDIINNYDFFKLYPFDGGGHFVNDSIVHSTENHVIVDNILNHNALENYGSLNNLDFHIYDNWSTIEQSCWINRLYFIVPLSKYAKDTKNKELADLIVNIILRFNNNPKSKEDAIDMEKEIDFLRERDYNSGANINGYINYQWYDFQPASRILHILYSMYFLQEYLSEEQFHNLINILKEHGKVLYWGMENLNFKRGNHEALRGFSLLLLGSYFNIDEWVNVGLKVCEYHILNDFLEDGMNLDISPSYHFFECWILRDINILCEKYNYTLSKNVKEMMNKAINLCFALCQPNGYSSVVSDGYSLDTNTYLQTLKQTETFKPYIYLPKSGIGIYKEKDDYLLFDSSPLLMKSSHFHGGKQSFIYNVNKEPFFVDSSCCPYDNKEFASYYKQCFAHSSMLVNGVGDSILQGQYTWNNNPICKLSNWENNKINSQLISNVPQWNGVTWNRSIEILDNGILIEDKVSSEELKEFMFIFNLHPDVEVKIENNQAFLTNNNVNLQVLFDLPINIKNGLYYDTKQREKKQLYYSINKKDFILKTKIIKD